MAKSQRPVVVDKLSSSDAFMSPIGIYDHVQVCKVLFVCNNISVYIPYKTNVKPLGVI